MTQLVIKDNETWLIRPDGWRYLLTGIHFGEWRIGYGWRDERAEVDIYLRDISDATLDSLRVVRDEFPDMHFHIETT